MTYHELSLYWLTVLFETLLCILVFVRGLQKRLPFFAAHTIVLVAGTIGLQVVYHHFGFRSTSSYNAYWLAAGLIMIARGFAVAELCRFELRAYQGIWALAWRILTILAVLLMGHAAVDAWGQINRIAMYGLTIERDFEISSVFVLLAMLLIHHYYGLTLEPLQRWIAVGMFLVCTIDVVNNTILRDALTGNLSYWLFERHVSLWSELRPRIEHATGWWDTVRLSALFISMSIWCFALRRPLPAPAQNPALLPAEVYRELSPAINLRLRAFNDRLLEMLKP
jgi:hypothetical protein